MKVLMLGWEFPPHISGGLGTACYGLVGGLRHHDVDVVFVVPHVFGDEDTSNARLLGARGWVVRPPATEHRIEPSAAPETSAARETGAQRETGARREISAPRKAGPSAARLGDAGRAETRRDPTTTEAASGAHGLAVADEPESEAELRVLGVDSALLPYLAPDQYGERVRNLDSDTEERDPVDASSRDRAVARAQHRAGGDPGASVDRHPIDWPAPPFDEEARDQAAGSEPGTAPGGSEPHDNGAPPGPISLGVQGKTGRYSRDLFTEVGRYTAVVEDIGRREPHDLVHAHDWMTFPAGVAAARASGKPLIVHVHSCEYDRSGDGANRRIVEIEQAGMDAADLVVCVSQYTASVVRARYRVDERKVRVVHNAVTRREQRVDWHQEKAIEDPVVLFLGRVTFQKGPDYFLQAAALVVKEEPSVRFVLGGSGDMLPRMIETAAQLGLARHVFFTGFLNGDDVERMYAMADLYVMPSVSEPFGIAPLEAMALDVPVIVSRQSGVAEILQHALKVDFWDVRDIAEKILAVLRRPALRKTLVESGREEVAQMSWDLRGRVLRDLYQELLP